METLIAVLALGTIGAVCIFGYRGANATYDRLRGHSPNSTLAADGPDARSDNEKVMPDV